MGLKMGFGSTPNVTPEYPQGNPKKWLESTPKVTLEYPQSDPRVWQSDPHGTQKLPLGHIQSDPKILTSLA